MKGFIASAIAACIEVRQCIREGSRELFDLHTHGHGGDISRGIDLQAEVIFVRHLSAYGSIFSEEGGWISPESSINIILDPIDGSDNFVSSFPYFGVSIARERNKETTEALVCNFASGEVFVRTEEAYYGCSLDNPDATYAIQTNPAAKVGLFEKSPEHPELIKLLMQQRLKFRSPGALALSLAYAPYVKYVLFLGTMRPYDIQAGLFLSRHLHLFQNDKYILISADKEVFEQIRFIVEKEYF